MFVLLISIIIALVIVIFAVQNASVVPIDFLIWSTDLPLVLVIFCSVFAGALLMFLLAIWRQIKNKVGKRSNSNKNNKVEQNSTLITEKKSINPDQMTADLSHPEKVSGTAE